MIIDSSL